MNRKYVLAVNPGSASTKVSLFSGDSVIASESIYHEMGEFAAAKTNEDQAEIRRAIIEKWMQDAGYGVDQLIAVVGRGGMLKPISSGTYRVCSEMLADLSSGSYGEHASNLGGMIAAKIAQAAGVDAYIVDPVSVDEFSPYARISGIPEIKRKSMLHALNCKQVAYLYADEIGMPLQEYNIIVAHLGGGISVVPIEGGKMVDANNANEMGPFSVERTGGLPSGDLAKICFSGRYTYEELKKQLRGSGGMCAYTGSNDIRFLGRLISGEEKALAPDGSEITKEFAKTLLEAMAYQIAKEIGSSAAVLRGDVRAIIITGGAAHFAPLTNLIKDRVSFIADVKLYPGDDELRALNAGVQRILGGMQEPKDYKGESINEGL